MRTHIAMAAGMAVALSASAFATPSTGTVTTFADTGPNAGATLGSGVVATVQSGGIRGGTSGERFFNVQGNDDSFASWGAVRFDLSDLYAELDAQAASAGLPGWQIQSATFGVEQSNASFSEAGGPIDVYHAPDDATDINPSTAAGTLGFGTVHGGNSMYDGSLGATSFLGQFNFTNIADGTLDSTDISAAVVLNELNARDSFLTLVLDTDDLGVQATYKGQDSPFQGVDAPSLAVSFKLIPSPGALAVFGLAGLTAARRRR